MHRETIQFIRFPLKSISDSDLLLSLNWMCIALCRNGNNHVLCTAVISLMHHSAIDFIDILPVYYTDYYHQINVTDSLIRSLGYIFIDLAISLF